MTLRALLLAAVALCAASCASGASQAPVTSAEPSSAVSGAPSAVQASPTPSQPPLTQVHDPGHVTGTLTGPCYTSNAGQFPDPACTPGSTDPAIDAAVLCNPTYTTSYYRPPSSETTRAKYQVVEPAYGQHNVSGELDHLVSLELGGSNDLSNLWVEAGAIPNAKDEVENRLHAWVCAGGPGVAQGRLVAAQRAIAADWLTAEQELGILP